MKALLYFQWLKCPQLHLTHKEEASWLQEHCSLMKPHQRNSTGITLKKGHLKHLPFDFCCFFKGLGVVLGHLSYYHSVSASYQPSFFSWLSLCYVWNKLWHLIQNPFPRVLWEEFLEMSSLGLTISSKSIWRNFRQVSGVVALRHTGSWRGGQRLQWCSLFADLEQFGHPYAGRQVIKEISIKKNSFHLL